MNTFIQQECFKLIKSESKNSITVSTKILNSPAVFNIDNKKNKKCNIY